MNLSRVGSIEQPTLFQKFMNTIAVDVLHFLLPPTKQLVKRKHTQSLKIRLVDNFDNS